MYRQPTDRIQVEYAHKPKPRSLPIPKEVNYQISLIRRKRFLIFSTETIFQVNNFMIENFGAVYYNSWDVSERLAILRKIEW